MKLKAKFTHLQSTSLHLRNFWAIPAIYFDFYMMDVHKKNVFSEQAHLKSKCLQECKLNITEDHHQMNWSINLNYFCEAARGFAWLTIIAFCYDFYIYQIFHTLNL